jgi:DNA adenine methylase
MQSKPIISWMGGKRRLAAQIFPFFPPHTCYVEPFAGGAALFFLRKTPAKVEVLNDTNGELVNLYRVVQNHPQELVRQFNLVFSSRQMFRWLQDQQPHTLTDIQRAARFYYLQQSAFGGRVAGQTYGTATTSSPKLKLASLQQILALARQRLAHTYVEQLPWQACIRRYDRAHTLFYCDPPYWQTHGYGQPFGFEQYQELAGMLRQIKGKAIVSLNDHEEIRRAFRGLPMKSLPHRHTVGGAAGCIVRELLIFSWQADNLQP